ncbi:phosphoglycerate mutase-like protein [Neoconidiobolus thromboides FSU 785]|nr:phosphoglycerate mutase-like protein [Neoconidiobolus thromboides FSU 785]
MTSTTEIKQKEFVLPRANSPKSDFETLKKLYPSNLELKHLLIVHRHGDRTPLSPRMPNLFPLKWNLCNSSNKGSSLLLKPSNPDSRLLGSDHENSPLVYHKVMEGVDGHGKTYNPKPRNSTSHFNTATCSYGQLTDIGRSTLYQHGEALKRIYVDHLKFVPQNFDQLKQNQVYLRSTDYPRTIDSLHHLLFGFYPNINTNTITDLIIRSRTHKDETMFMDFTCNRLVQLKKEFDLSYRPELKKEWQTFRELLINETSLADDLKSKEFDHPTAIHKVYDTISSAYAHGIKLPDGYTEQHHAKLDELEVKLWFKGFLESKENVKLGIGRFYQDINYHLQQAVENKEQNEAKLSFFSGHDTTVGPFVIGLGAFDNKWPAYGSIAMVELFEDKQHKSNQKQIANSQENYYVRVKYNDQVLTLPHCAKSGNHHPELGGTFCKMDAFVKLLHEMSPKKYYEECKGFKDEISDR